MHISGVGDLVRIKASKTSPPTPREWLGRYGIVKRVRKAGIFQYVVVVFLEGPYDEELLCKLDEVEDGRAQEVPNRSDQAGH